MPSRSSLATALAALIPAGGLGSCAGSAPRSSTTSTAWASTPRTTRSTSPLGLVESTDAGESWRPVSLLGEADLHSIEVAGDRTYAYGSTSQSLIVSDDRQRWTVVAQLLALRDIATDPDDPDSVLVVSDRGELLRSTGGAEPSPVYGAPPALTAIDWEAGGPLVGVTTEGAVMVSADGEGEWREAGSVGALVEALDVVPGRWHVATGSDMLESTDDGATWDVVLERDG